MMRKLTAAAALMTMWTTSTALAEEVPEAFTPVRPAGMGGAFTAIANDQDSIWTNPAGISRSRKSRSRGTFSVARFPNVIVGANSESRTFYSALKSSADQSVEAIVESADGLGDKPFWARAAVFPVTIFTVSREAPMAFGMYSNNTIKAVIEKDTPDEARIESVSDFGVPITFATSASGNRFNLGLQVRPMMRYAYEGRVPSSELLDKTAMQDHIENDSNKTQGIGVDVGMMYTIADFWYPTVGISVLNLPTGCKTAYLNPFTEKSETVCGNLFRGEVSNEDALSVIDPTDLRMGVSITPRFGRKFAARVALDVHHLAIPADGKNYGLSGIEASKLIHGGVEFFVGNPLELSPFSVRTGYSQGFASYGASVNLGYLILDFASFGRDVSSSESPIEDRRYLGSLSFGF